MPLSEEKWSNTPSPGLSGAGQELSVLRLPSLNVNWRYLRHGEGERDREREREREKDRREGEKVEGESEGRESDTKSLGRKRRDDEWQVNLNSERLGIYGN